MEGVTGVLLERAHHAGGLPRMITLSLCAHTAFFAVLILVPAFRGSQPVEDLRPVMTVSLGGAPGPRAGGMTMMGRPIQSTAPLADVRRPAPVRRPAEQPPAMVLPVPSRAPVKVPPKGPAPRTQAPAAAAAPAVAARQPFGAAAPAEAPNPNQGLGFGGLSTGGGTGTGGYLDVANFCCPDYLVIMLQVIQNNWTARQEVGGETLVTFTILRDGRITGIELERSSGYAALDLTAQRALFLTQRVPPLPSAFRDDHLTVHLRFQYRR